MSELAQVAAALAVAAAAGESSVLATVVRTDGSTYRRMGARLVARPDGVRTGAVSAGCLEGDVIARAAEVLANPEPIVVTYDSRSPEDLVWGFGLGCGGMVEVLLEPVDPAAAIAKSKQLASTAARRARSVLVTVIRAAPDAPLHAGDQASLTTEATDATDATDATTVLDGFPTADASLRARIADTARTVLHDGHSIAVRHDDALDIAYELVIPTVRLGVCGAGVDAKPLVAAAKHVGWHVTLIDDRPAMATRDRWPDVDGIIIADPNRLGAAVAAADCDAAIIMSHNFERDLEFLGAWVAGPTPYIGVLGPRRRTEQMITALGLDGAAAAARIRGPVGLDIGAETAEEIALAIVAEVQAAHTGRAGGAISKRDGPIHV